MTNKYQSNSHLQGTNEGNKNKVEESKIICFVAFNQTLHKGFDYSGEEHTHTLGSFFTSIIAIPGTEGAPRVKTGAGLHWFRYELDLSSSWKIPGPDFPVPSRASAVAEELHACWQLHIKCDGFLTDPIIKPGLSRIAALGFSA